jgi:hypothetical protein
MQMMLVNNVLIQIFDDFFLFTDVGHFELNSS